MKKLIFFGTSNFARIILERIKQDSFFNIVGVVTTPDKLAGRKKTLTPSPIKQFISDKYPDTPLWQPAKLDENFTEELKQTNADYFLVCAYGKIIPDSILEIPSLGSINIHPSALPHWRGPSPLQATLLAGEPTTQTTIMVMDAKMDHGPIIAQSDPITIDPNEIFPDFHDRLAEISFELLKNILPKYFNHEITPHEQDHDQATFCHMIQKSNGQIDWTKTSTEIFNMYRAYYLWPQIFSGMKIKNQNLNIKFTDLILTDQHDSHAAPGELIIQSKRLFITGSDHRLIEIASLQPQGKKEMDATSFINGYLR